MRPGLLTPRCHLHRRAPAPGYHYTLDMQIGCEQERRCLRKPETRGAQGRNLCQEGVVRDRAAVVQRARP